MAEKWFPTTANDTPGWRLDIVSLLAVIGESSMADHAQAMTASWLCCLPRVVPAPQVLLKPTRPTRMPQVNASVVGVENGTFVETLNYFPNIMHPIDELPAYAFRVYTVKHSMDRVKSIEREFKEEQSKATGSAHNGNNSQLRARAGLPPPATANTPNTHPHPGVKRRLTNSLRPVLSRSNQIKRPPLVPPRTSSPLNLLSIFSCVLTIGLFILSVLEKDGVACVALVTISLASSIVGYASMWKPELMKRNSDIDVPRGDVVIRTREGALIVVKCDENVSRELYTGTEKCVYVVQNVRGYRVLVGMGTFLLMVSVVLLGNCNFSQQVAIGGSYIVLNGLFWGAALMPKRTLWNMSLYEIKQDKDAPEAELGDGQDEDPEMRPSFTRTMWYAIRETESIGWVRRIGAAPVTPQWDE